jgi:hypothetical protein
MASVGRRGGRRAEVEGTTMAVARRGRGVATAASVWAAQHRRTTRSRFLLRRRLGTAEHDGGSPEEDCVGGSRLLTTPDWGSDAEASNLHGCAPGMREETRRWAQGLHVAEERGIWVVVGRWKAPRVVGETV